MNCIYDVETFPNFFSVCFYELEGKRFRDFVIHETRNDLDELRRYWLNVGWKIGFNNIRFDDIIMRFIMEGGDDVSPRSINNLCQAIINTQREGEALWQNRLIKRYLRPYKYSIDLMKIHALHKIGVSLKQVGVVLNHPRLEDLPKDPLDDIADHEISNILDYGRNDVIITRLLYEYSRDDINLRMSIGDKYKVNVKSESKTYIAKTILDKYYEQFTGLKISEFKDLRTYHKSIKLSTIINEFDFKTKALQDLYSDLLGMTVKPQDKEFKFSKLVKTKAMTHKLALGGLHSKNKNNIYEEDETYALLDVDFASYYPNIMLKYGFAPAHVNKKEFLRVLKSITTQRLKAKAEGDKITDSTLKISINSLYGLLGFDAYWLKDDKTMYSVTVNGQLLLLGVIEFLESLGDVTCVYSNTDGATFKVKRTILDEVIKKVDLISNHIGINLEYVMFKKMIVKDVNNFLIVKKDGEIKIKGSFGYTQDITRGFRHPIVQKALYNYYIDGVPVEQTINEETNIYSFCIAQRTGKQFKTFFRTVDGLKQMQKTNRYFVSTKSGSLVKIKEKEEGGQQINQAVANENVYILNDFNSEDNEEYLSLVKRQYYIKETNKIVNSFVQNQLKLF